MITTIVSLPIKLDTYRLGEELVRFVGNPHEASLSAHKSFDGMDLGTASRGFGTQSRNYLRVWSTDTPFQWSRPASKEALENRAEELALNARIPLDEARDVVIESELIKAAKFADYPADSRTIIRIATDSLAGTAGEGVLWEHLVYAMRMRGKGQVGILGDWLYPDSSQWRMLSEARVETTAAIRGRGESTDVVRSGLLAAEERISAATMSGAV